MHKNIDLQRIYAYNARMDTQLKTCSKCGEVKPIDLFNKKHGKPRYWCRTCDHESFKIWHSKQPASYKEKKRVASKTWREKNPDSVIEQRGKIYPCEVNYSYAKYAKTRVSILSDAYVKQTILGRTRRSVMSAIDVTDDMIELKRDQLLMHRLTNQLKQLLKESKDG